MDNKPENIKNYKILRQQRGGALTHRFYVKDYEGSIRTIIMPVKEKYIAKYEFENFCDEMPDEMSEKDVETRFEKDMLEFGERYKRVIGLSHPNVAEVYSVELDEETGVPFAVMEHVEGNPIFYETSKLSPMQMISLFVPILEGLAFIHDNELLHLNIKAERVFALDRLDNYQVKLIDFGFAIPFDKIEGELKGTPAYIAPEVAFGMHKHIGMRSDLFSVAVLMYYCLARQMPFPARQIAGANLRKLKMEIEQEGPPSPIIHYNSSVPKELDDLILGLLNKTPDDRPFEFAGDVLAYFYKNWPKECKEMPIEKTITFREKEETDD